MERQQKKIDFCVNANHQLGEHIRSQVQAELRAALMSIEHRDSTSDARFKALEERCSAQEEQTAALRSGSTSATTPDSETLPDSETVDRSITITELQQQIAETSQRVNILSKLFNDLKTDQGNFTHTEGSEDNATKTLDGRLRCLEMQVNRLNTRMNTTQSSHDARYRHQQRGLRPTARAHPVFNGVSSSGNSTGAQRIRHTVDTPQGRGTPPHAHSPARAANLPPKRREETLIDIDEPEPQQPVSPRSSTSRHG